MSFHNCSDYSEMSKAVADRLIQKIQELKQCRIGIATGRSPKMVYQLLADHLSQNSVLKNKIEILQIDEWYGLSKEHPSSCHFSIVNEIIRPWKLTSNQYFLLEGDSNQVAQMIAMHKSLEERPLDICILGFGRNGHVAFNEPGSLATSTCRISKLDKVSQSHTMVSDVEHELKKGMTIGLHEIMKSKEVLLLITGEGKEEAYQRFLNKADVNIAPASVLYGHDNWECYVDNSLTN